MSTKLLTNQQIEQYRTEGYIVVDSLIDSSSLKRIDDAIVEITDKALESEEFSEVLELELGEVTKILEHLKLAHSNVHWATLSEISQRVQQIRTRFLQQGSTADRLQIEISR